MAYELVKSDGTTLIELADGVTDTGSASITFVGKNAGNNAMAYHSQYSGNTPYREIFTRNNLAIRRRTDVRRSPQLRENVWVNAYSFDMTLGFAVQTAHDIDWADKITVNGELIPLP